MWQLQPGSHYILWFVNCVILWCFRKIIDHSCTTTHRSGYHSIRHPLVIVEQEIVTTSSDLGAAVADFLGTIYAANYAYPGKRHMCEFIQSTLLGIEAKKSSAKTAKVFSVREKLARVKQWHFTRHLLWLNLKPHYMEQQTWQTWQMCIMPSRHSGQLGDKFALS